MDRNISCFLSTIIVNEPKNGLEKPEGSVVPADSCLFPGAVYIVVLVPVWLLDRFLEVGA